MALEGPETQRRRQQAIRDLPPTSPEKELELQEQLEAQF